MTQLLDTIELLYDSPLGVISNALRGFITAAPGNDLIVADFSQIEARGLAWLCDEEKALQTFRDGLDIYCVAAEDVYGYPVDKKKHPDERQVGKTVILACGYGGSVGAFQAMAKTTGAKVEDKRAKEIVTAWRGQNPTIVGYWSACEAAAIAAIQTPGSVHKAGAPGREVMYRKSGSFLLCRLPSGRKLSYPYARLLPHIWVKRQKDDETESRRIQQSDLPRYLARGWSHHGTPSPGIVYKYQDPTTKQWVEGPTYGGSLVENITQAVCRDILAEAMLRVEAAGYPVVMHVHDEIVSEVAEDFGSKDEFCAVMAEVPTWATGFPIAAEGYRRRRYKK
jgi:DNA polymerase